MPSGEQAGKTLRLHESNAMFEYIVGRGTRPQLSGFAV